MCLNRSAQSPEVANQINMGNLSHKQEKEVDIHVKDQPARLVKVN